MYPIVPAAPALWPSLGSLQQVPHSRGKVCSAGSWKSYHYVIKHSTMAAWKQKLVWNERWLNGGQWSGAQACKSGAFWAHWCQARRLRLSHCAAAMASFTPCIYATRSSGLELVALAQEHHVSSRAPVLELCWGCRIHFSGSHVAQEAGMSVSTGLPGVPVGLYAAGKQVTGTGDKAGAIRTKWSQSLVIVMQKTTCQHRRCEFDPRWRKIHGEMAKPPDYIWGNSLIQRRLQSRRLQKIDPEIWRLNNKQPGVNTILLRSVLFIESHQF